MYWKDEHQFWETLQTVELIERNAQEIRAVVFTQREYMADEICCKQR
jgi:hypothetical protein